MTSTVNKRRGIWMLRVIAASALLVFSSLVSAAEYPVRGTIQSVQQDGGIIRISGRDLNYREGVVSITLNGREMQPQFLSEGMVVLYTLSSNGYLRTIAIIGPQSVVDGVDDN